MSLNGELSQLFSTLAAVMEIKGESVFKAIAFTKIARVLGELSEDVKTIVAEDRLKEVEGVGPASRRIIEQYVATGRSVDFDEAVASVPAGLIPLFQIPGLGPKTVALLWKERGVTSLEQLVQAIESNALDGLKGIGAKKIESIKQGIALRAQAAGRLGIGEALEIAEALLARVRAMTVVRRAEIGGSLRRRKETIGDVDLVCALTDDDAGEQVTAAFVQFPEVERVLGQGNTKASVLVVGGLQVDLRVVPADNFGAALQYFTGSKDHNKTLRGVALDQGMTLNEWGLYKLAAFEKAEKKTGQPPALKPVASKDERDVYAALGLEFVEPELREDRGEIEAAAAKKLPALITVQDLRGDLHAHTVASDGVASILEMAEAAKALGYAFLAVTDHSKSQVIANGLTKDRLLKHVKAIRAANDQVKGITLLAGCEVDILVDGRLDFEDAVLAELDWVVASPHVSLKQDERKATDRLLRAIDNAYVNVIGHPTGRLILRREGLPLDFPKLFAAAARNGTALEINAGYPRLDLNDVNARNAVAAGCKLSINTDAHSTEGLGGMRYGIDVARRAWVTPADVVNCLSERELRAFVKRKRPK